MQERDGREQDGHALDADPPGSCGYYGCHCVST